MLIWVREFSCGYCSHGGEEVVLAKKKRRTEDSEGTEKKKSEVLEETAVLMWLKNEDRLASFL